MQFIRYSVVGLMCNISGYLIYLLLTKLGIGPKTAMSMLYAAGATAGFIGNRQWVFSHNGSVVFGLVRYVIAHLLGYTLNFTILFVFVDHHGVPHHWVQAAAVFIVAVFLYPMFRFFVFSESLRTTIESA